MSAAVDLKARAAAFARNGHLDAVPDDGMPATRAPETVTASELMRRVFPEPQWAVPGIVAEGLTLLVGAPKVGKSWLALNAAVAVALGGRALGSIPVDAGGVLYLALEDTERRLQDRLRRSLADSPAPDRLTLATAWPAIPDGGLRELARWLSDHPETRLVIIDTLARFRGPVDGRANAYSADYEAASAVKQLADKYGVAIVLVHHTRKASADDPLDTVSGTAGLAGAADTTCVLRREIGRADAALYVRGRDVSEADHAVSFDPATCTWNLLGDASEFRRSGERQAILDLLRTASEPMRPKAIADTLGRKDGAVRKLLYTMVKSGEVDNVGGRYRVPISPSNTGNTGNALSEIPMESKIPVTKSVTGQDISCGNGNAPEVFTLSLGNSGHERRRGVTGTVTADSEGGNALDGENPDDVGLFDGNVTGVTSVAGSDTPHAVTLFGDVATGGMCEVCGDMTNGNPLCWSCR